jgi:hypothetical protein
MNFKDFANSDFNENTSLKEWVLNEVTTATRYSIEINYRSEKKEVLLSYAKIVLGYVSAAMKQNGYHIKQVFEESPVRILVSTRNWDDGEWAGMVYFHPEHDGGCFVAANGFFNKQRVPPTISIQNTRKCGGDSAADVTKELRNMMHDLRKQPDKTRERQKLKAVPMKRGPKR